MKDQKKPGGKPAPKPKPDIPTDEPGQQPVPDADALIELTGAAGTIGGIIDLAKVGAALAASGVDASRSVTDRMFSSMFKDTDIGQDEVMRSSLGLAVASLSGLALTLNHATGMKALNNEHIEHARNSDSQFWTSIDKGNGTFQNALLKNDGLTTPTEVLQIAALGEVVKALAGEVAGIKQAIFDAIPKT
jgi:hypothetical protein